MKIGDKNLRDIDMGCGLIKKGEMSVTNIVKVPIKGGIQTTTTFKYIEDVDKDNK